METKKCTGKCGLEKTFNFFPKASNKCKVCVAEYQKEYRKENKEKASKYQKEYYQENREELLKNKKEYCQVNKEKIAVYQKEYQKENKEKNREKTTKYKKEWSKERKEIDPIYKLMCNFRNGFKKWVKSNGISKNGVSTFNCLPFYFEEYLAHIESQFAWWMTFENQGVYDPKTWDDNDPKTWRWQLDHIKPSSTFILKSIDDIETIRECWALSNLRPYSAKQNVLDGATRIRHQI